MRESFFYSSLPNTVVVVSRKVDIIIYYYLKNYQLQEIAKFKQKDMERHEKRVYLDINYVFGSNCYLPLKNSISFIEQDDKIKLIYTAGKTIIKKQLKSNVMQFIKLSDNTQSIQCLAIPPTRTHIAICQKIKNQNFILLNLYGLKTRDSEIKHFKLPQTDKQATFKIIAFAPSQPKYACCLTGQPQNQLLFLDISRSRGLAVSNFPIIDATSLAICPTQSHIISVCGKNLFKLYKVEDYSFKATQEIKKLPKNRNYTVHCWFDKTKILVGTDKGQLFIIGPIGTNYQVKRNFANIFSEQQTELAITEIAVLSKGFIVASSQGNFALWIKKQQNEQNFDDECAGEFVKSWKTPPTWASQVICIAVSPKEQYLAVGLKCNAIAILKMNIILNDNAEPIADSDLFEFMHNGFHQGPITGMDVCLHRPIIVTLSKTQKVIRLWNYKHPSSELVKKFDSKVDGIEQINSNELLNCLAIHPFGYYLAVGFCDKLRIYHILMTELRIYKEIVLRGVCQLKFANGGHLLAAAYSKQKHNIHLINVYNSYTLEQIARLGYHSHVITELYWKPDDRALYSLGMDGFVIEWKYEAKKQNKEWECRKWSQPNAKYSSGVYQRSSKSLLVAGQELGKNIVREFKLEKDQVQKIYTMGFKTAKLQWLNSQWNVPAIILGTDEGAIKVFNSPFDNIVEQTLNVHLKQITKIQVSPCGRYVFSVGEDCNIFIFQVSLTNRQGVVSKRLNDQVNEYELNPLVGVLDDELSDVVLLQRSTLTEKLRYIKMLQKNLEEMKNKIILQDDQNIKNNKYQLNKLENLLNQKIQSLSKQFQELKTQKKSIESSIQVNFLDLQNKNNKMFQDIELLYEKKLTMENQKYYNLQKQYQKIKYHNLQLYQSITNDTSNLLIELKNNFIDTFKKAQKVHMNKQNQLISGQKIYKEKVVQIEEQHQEQLKKVNKKINQVIKLKDIKNNQFLTNIQSYTRQIKFLKQQTSNLIQKNDNLTIQISTQKKQFSVIQKQIGQKSKKLTEKQQQIKTKQQKLDEYQQKIKNIQKKKNILNYRTLEMKQEIQPRQNQIEFLKEQLFLLEIQFENLLKDQKNLKDTQICIIKDKQKLQKKIKQLKYIAKDKQSKIKNICDEINTLVQNKNTQNKYLQQKINNIYQKYLHLITNNNKINQNTNGNQEMLRHIEHLKHQICDISDKTAHGLIKRQDDLRKTILQNKSLIKQLSQFRLMKQKLIDELKNVTKISETIRRQMVQMKNKSLKLSSPFKNHQNIDNKLDIRSIQSLLPSVKKNMIRSASGPSIRGKLIKGNNFDGEKLINLKKIKISQLEDKLEIAKNYISQRQMELSSLKSLIKTHKDQQHCIDPLFQRFLCQYQL